MGKNVASKLNKGISPQQFIDSHDEKQRSLSKTGTTGLNGRTTEDREFFESMNNRDDLRCLILRRIGAATSFATFRSCSRRLKMTGIPTEVLIMEEHLDTMDEFLTMGGRSIPIVLIRGYRRPCARPMGTASEPCAGSDDCVQTGESRTAKPRIIKRSLAATRQEMGTPLRRRHGVSAVDRSRAPIAARFLLTMLKIETFTLGRCRRTATSSPRRPASAAFIIDPGMEPKRLIERIRERDLTIEAIVLTHAHFDHMGGVDDSAQSSSAARSIFMIWKPIG